MVDFFVKMAMYSSKHFKKGITSRKNKVYLHYKKEEYVYEHTYMN